MPESGYYNNFEKYNRPEDEENEISKEDNEEVDRVVALYDNLSSKLNADTRKRLGLIVDIIEKKYDSEDDSWSEFLSAVDSVLAELAAATDDDEREQAQLDILDELDSLENRAKQF